MLENGTLAKWKVSSALAARQFTLEGDYDWPMRFTPDRKILFYFEFRWCLDRRDRYR